MIIKTFTAESAAAALKKVRAELGKDAVVLKTRELPFGRGTERMEITACIDKPAVQEQPVAPVATLATRQTVSRQVQRATFPNITKTEAAPVAAAQEPTADLLAQTFERMTSLEEKISRILANGSCGTNSEETSQIRQQLGEVDLPASFINELVSSIANEKHGDINSVLRTRLTDTLTSLMLPGLSFVNGDRIAFFGYAGAGKTSALGKLAARLVYQEKQKVALVSLDSVKIGAFEELSSYADILGSDAVDYQTAASQPDATAITLIDTPALPRQQEQWLQLCGQIEALKPNYRFLVISAMTRSVDVEKIASQVSTFNPTHVIFTMLDLTDRWGSVVAACKTAQVPLAFVTNAPAGMGTVNVPDPANFTRSLLTTEECRG